MPNNENLIPFKKGFDERRNSGGRPKGVPNCKTRLNKLLSLVQKVENKITGEPDIELTIAEQMDIAIMAKALKGDIMAYREVMDRMEGKAGKATSAEPKYGLDAEESQEFYVDR